MTGRKHDKADPERRPEGPAGGVDGSARELSMRDKYLELLNKAKASAKIEISDETLRKGYDQANKQPEPGSDPVAPAPQQ